MSSPIRSRLSTLSVALLTSHAALFGGAALTLIAMPAHAATAPKAATSAPRITAFDVQGIESVVAGADLDFTLWGSANSQASLSIDGAQRALALTETSPGIYKGTYTISSRDRIASDARVVANLRQGRQVATARLGETLLANAVAPLSPPNAPNPAYAPALEAPRIDRFTLDQDGNRRNGSDLTLRLSGTPGAQVSVQLPLDPARRVQLTETSRGEYTGTYRMQPGDNLRPREAALARLRIGDKTSTARLDNALDRSNARYDRSADDGCTDCGKVVSINRISVDGDGHYIGGSVAGGLLGAVIGSQFGGGDGKKVAGVAGAVGGALLGREMQKRNERHEVFEVVAEMRDGARRSAQYEQAPSLRVGDSVRLSSDARFERL